VNQKLCNLDVDLLQILPGFAFPSKYFSSKGIPLIRIRDLNKTSTEIAYSGEYGDEFLVNNGDLLVGMDGDFFPVIWSGPQALLNQRVCKLIPKNGLDKKFLFYSLVKPLKEIQNRMGKTTVKHLSANDFEKIKIWIPNISDQNQIATILSTVDDALANNERERQAVERLKAGLMKKLLEKKEWPKAKLGELITLEYGSGLSVNQRKAGKFPVFGSNGIIGYHMHSLVKGPGIIVGRKGSIGEVSFSESDFWPIDTTYYVVPKEELNLNWIYYLLTTLNLSKLNTATGIPGLNRDLVYTRIVSVPSLEEQKNIVEILSKVDELQATQFSQKQKLERIKKGLMNDLLSGGKRVNV
jgi:type I restriction enzyme S subunit